LRSHLQDHIARPIPQEILQRLLRKIYSKSEEIRSSQPVSPILNLFLNKT